MLGQWVSGWRAAVLAVLTITAVLAATGVAPVAGASSDEATVKFAYVDSADGHVTLVLSNGTKIDTGVSAAIVGTGADLDGDRYVEVPYVSSQTLAYVDRTGETTTVASNARSSKTKVAVGDLEGDGNGTRIFYARKHSTKPNYLMSVSPTGEKAVVGGGYKATAALGVADVTGDGINEIVFVGGSTGLHYYNASAGQDVTFYTSGIGSNGGLGVGAPRDFDDDGVARVPIVTGSNNGVLVEVHGNDATTTTVVSGIAKHPVAGVDWTANPGVEFLYAAYGSTNTVKYATLGGATGAVSDASGDDIVTTDSAGVAWLAAGDEPLTVSNVTLTGGDRSLTLSFETSEQLESVNVTLDGPQSTTFTLSEFDEHSSGGTWTYNRTYAPAETGEYTATLHSARSTDGDSPQSTHEDSATVVDTFSVRNLTVSVTNNSSYQGVESTLHISFEADEKLSSLDVDVSGAENATLDLSNFSTADGSSPYTYTGTYNASHDGEYTVTVDSATSQDGQTDSGDLIETATVDHFRTWNFSMGSESGTLVVSFNSSEDLASTTVPIDGPDGTTLDLSNFTEVASGEEYGYRATYTPSKDGDYTAILDRAESDDGDVSNPDYTADATVDTRFNVSDLNATADGSQIDISFNASETLGSLDMAVSGAENASLGLSAFATNDSSAPYTYTGTYDTSQDGTFNVTLDQATSQDGQVDDANLTDSATVDARFNVSDLTVSSTNESTFQGVESTLHIRFEATETLGSVTINISGPESATLDLSNVSTDDSSAPYVYTGTYNASHDGEYTVTVDRATSQDGQVDDGDLIETATVNHFRTWNFSMGSESGSLVISFNSSEDLASTTVPIDGPDGTTFDLSNFTEVASGDEYGYRGTYTPNQDGDYTAILDRAESDEGDVSNPDYTADATIDTRFNVTALNATADGDQIDISFNASETLGSLDMAVSGAENATLDLSNFSTDDGSAPYTYTGTYNTSEDGTFDVTLDQATSQDGQVNDENLTDSATVDARFNLSELGVTVANDSRYQGVESTLHISFEATETLGSVTINISGPESATLDLSNVSTDDSSAPYTYTGTYNTSRDGEYTVTVDRATSQDGQVDDGDLVENATVDYFRTWNFTAVNESGSLVVSFNASEDLSSTTVPVEGPDGTTLTLSNFTEIASGDEYGYRATYTPSADGDYTATLDRAESDDGDVSNPDDTANVTIDARFNVTDLTATSDGSQVDISFNASETLGSLDMVVSGAENATLDLSNFTTSDSSAPYTYTGTYNTSEDGTFNVTLDQATSQDGQVDDENLTDSATVDTRFDVRKLNVTVTNNSTTSGVESTLTIAFEATEKLGSASVTISGAENATLDRSRFSTDGGSAPYTYTGVYNASHDGEYTVTVDSATSQDGQVDDGDLVENATVDHFRTWNFSMEFESGSLVISFNASEGLTGTTVPVDGPDGTTLDRSNFTEVASGDEYGYRATYTPEADGNYTATLDRAVSDESDVSNPDYTAAATVDVRFNVSDLNATAAPGHDIDISFTTTEPLGSLEGTISGPENATLDLSNVSTDDGSAPYTYTGTYDAEQGGNYTVTLDQATSQDGQVDTETLTDEVRLPDFEAYNLTLTTAGDGDLAASFQATADVETATLSLTGPAGESVTFGDFTQVESDPHTYEATLNASVDGNYTITLSAAHSTTDGTWSGNLTANATLDAREPTILNATLTDATDGNGVVNTTDQVTVTANVSGDVERVSADLTSFGAGTVELTQVDTDTYRVTVAVEGGTNGPHTVTVTANDGQGSTASAQTGTVVLDTTAPVITLGANRTVTVGEPVTFSPETADDDVTRVVTLTWAFGDGTSATDSIVSHTYDSPGQYVVTLTGTDAAENVDRATLTVTVEAADTDTSTGGAASGGSGSSDTGSMGQEGDQDQGQATETPTPTPTPSETATPTETPPETVQESSSGDSGMVSQQTTDTAPPTATATTTATPSATPRRSTESPTVQEHRAGGGRLVTTVLPLLLVLLILALLARAYQRRRGE